MNQTSDLLNRMHIAAPCHVGWEKMEGDERARFCTSCNLHVYNIADLTAEEVRELVIRTEGRLCARLYRKTDGTIITKDCPVGLRKYRRRLAKVAGAGLAAVLSLCTISFGQHRRNKGDKSCPAVELKVKRSLNQGQEGLFTGRVLDPNGAVVPAARIVLLNEKTNEKFSVESDSEGEFKFAVLPEGKYTLRIEQPGFKSYEANSLTVNPHEALQADLILQLGDNTVTIGIFVETPMVERENGTTIFHKEFIEKMPLRK